VLCHFCRPVNGLTDRSVGSEGAKRVANVNGSLLRYATQLFRVTVGRVFRPSRHPGCVAALPAGRWCRALGGANVRHGAVPWLCGDGAVFRPRAEVRWDR